MNYNRCEKCPGQHGSPLCLEAEQDYHVGWDQLMSNVIAGHNFVTFAVKCPLKKSYINKTFCVSGIVEPFRR